MSGVVFEVKLDAPLDKESVQQLEQRLRDLSQLMGLIGDKLTESAIKRFDTSTAPDGTPWAPNLRTTYERLSQPYLRKNGRLTEKGRRCSSLIPVLPGSFLPAPNQTSQSSVRPS